MVHYYRDSCPPDADQKCCGHVDTEGLPAPINCGDFGHCSVGICECSVNYRGERCESAPAYKVKGAMFGALELNGIYERLSEVKPNSSTKQLCNGRPTYQMRDWKGDGAGH